MTTHAPAYYRDVLHRISLMESAGDLPQWFRRAWQTNHVHVAYYLGSPKYDTIVFNCRLFPDDRTVFSSMQVNFLIRKTAIGYESVIHPLDIALSTSKYSDADLRNFLQTQLGFDTSLVPYWQWEKTAIANHLFTINPVRLRNYLKQQLEPITSLLWHLGQQELDA